MTRIKIGYTHYFIDEYLNSIKTLMHHAKNNEHDIHDYIYTMPVIILVMSFLESAFDLFLYDLKNINFGKISKTQKDNIIKKYTEQYKKLRNRYTIEQKYNDSLSIMSFGKINNTNNIETIRNLRNYMVHDRVELIAPWTEKTQDYIVESLKNKFVPQCRILDKQYFWANYINYNGTTWILNEIFNFYIAFCSCLGLKSLFADKIREIQTLYPCVVKSYKECLNAK
ncbi:hypothetical protein J6Q66_03135 [bacterium]|nr:hypothetical protein [bacterium]